MIQITNEERAVYQSLVDMYAKANYKPIITFEKLRLESVDLTNQQSIAFAINNDDTSIAKSITEKRLKLGNKFTATRFGLFVANIPAGQTRSNTIRKTFANNFTFTTKADEIQAIYNANINMKVNSVDYFDQFGTEVFEKVPVLPEGIAVTQTTAIPASTSAAILRDPLEEWDGYIQMLPTVTLSGGKDNQLEIALAEAIDLAAVAGANIAIIIMWGFMQQNVNSGNINKILPVEKINEYFLRTDKF